MSQQRISSETRYEGSVSPAFPLALLEAVRSHDHPGEVLEDEDLTVSMPRRFGLTGVVETQIMRYEAAQRSGGTVRLDEVVNLIRLVLRRPDAEAILAETGQRIARWQFSRTPQLWRHVLRKLPTSMALRSARRSAVRSLTSLQAGRSVVAEKPFTIRLDNCLTADLDDAGAGCALFTGLLEETVALHTGTTLRLSPPRRVPGICVWSLPTTG